MTEWGHTREVQVRLRIELITALHASTKNFLEARFLAQEYWDWVRGYHPRLEDPLDRPNFGSTPSQSSLKPEDSPQE